ncbi:helix-turn-helix domain-containing protein [Scytonema hofmannii]|uniref:helix-turn-helix domain-containing protein n=1 Tax=Scytonema hofmannii TaxID=34078 RepID=UPI00037FAD93|nr:helix-turn-helix transcriptional regulator [Scytonema hofmannii]
MRVDKRQKGSQEMIRWRLRILMAEKKISNKELSEISGIHRTSISKLKNTDEIEQISGRVINSLCNALTIAYRARGDNRSITPNDLFEYTFDGDRPSPTSISTETSVTEDTSTTQQSSNFNGTTKASAQLVWLVVSEELA